MNLKQTIGSLSLGILLAGSTALAAAQESTPGVIGDPTANECVTDLGTTEVPENASGYVINSEESQASFTVTEELAGQGLNDAVGTTNAVIGTIVIDNDGNPLICSRIDVDLRTLVTDESRRDARIQDALNTSDHPVATFIVTEITSLDGSLEDGNETELTLVGNLTINGVEKQVSWHAMVTLEDGTVTGSATTLIRFDDYGVNKPVMGPVMSIEDEVTLIIDIVAAVE